MREAVIAAMRHEMLRDPTVILIGEDVAEAGGVFKTSEGLLEEFGPRRVRDTPISEMGFLGAAVGAAATGLRPIVEIMFVEFLGVALDQLSTQAAKLSYLSAGAYSVPMVVRATTGAGLGFGAQHSQSMETWLYATPGLKVAVASGARSAYGLLRTAVRDEGPVVVLEPRALYATREEFVPDEAAIPVGSAHLVVSGRDATVVALGSTVHQSEEAFATTEISVDIIDLQWLVPWDRAFVLESVRKTGRLVVVEEGPFTGGWGTEVVSYVASHAFDALVAPPLRITAPDVPVPFGKHLEARYLPSSGYIAAQVADLVEFDALPEPWWVSIGAAG